MLIIKARLHGSKNGLSKVESPSISRMSLPFPPNDDATMCCKIQVQCGPQAYFPRTMATIAFTMAPAMCQRAPVVVPKTMIPVPESQSTPCPKAWNATTPQKNLAISLPRLMLQSPCSLRTIFIFLYPKRTARRSTTEVQSARFSGSPRMS